MSQKYCPRCGSLYASLKSSTCPQCFAILDEIDDETARKIAEENAFHQNSDEFLDAKNRSDEEFRHKSFQACLGCFGLIVLTAIVSGIIIWKAISYNKHHNAQHNAIAAAHPLKSQPLPSQSELPEDITGFQKKTDDQVGLLSGTLSKINHSEYGKPSSIDAIDVYYISSEYPVTDKNQFIDAVRLLAYLGKDKPRPYVLVKSSKWMYAVISSGSDNNAKVSVESFSDALTSIVKGTKQTTILETGGLHE